MVRMHKWSFWGLSERCFEQPLFCREVILKRLVIVHVFARQIREDRRLEGAAPEPVHRQRVRAGFEHRVLPSGIADLCKKSLQVNRLWRGVRGGGNPARALTPHCSQTTPFPA